MLWLYIFMVKWDLMIVGAGYAVALTSFLLWASVTLISQRIERIRPALLLPSRDSFRGWGEYFAVSIPATVMLCCEWWYFESLILLASSFGTAQLAA